MSVSATEHVATAAAAGETAQGRRWRVYRAVWRWHFYAGLLVLPFIAWLALTGAAFLYHDAIDRTAHHALKVVPVGPARLSAQQLVTAAQRAQAGTVFRYTTPDRADASAEIGVLRTDGARGWCTWTRTAGVRWACCPSMARWPGPFAGCTAWTCSVPSRVA